MKAKARLGWFAMKPGARPHWVEHGVKLCNKIRAVGLNTPGDPSGARCKDCASALLYRAPSEVQDYISRSRRIAAAQQGRDAESRLSRAPDRLDRAYLWISHNVRDES